MGQESRENGMAMNESLKPPTPHCAARTHHLSMTGDLRNHVSALLGIEATVVAPLPRAIAPHDALVLAVQFTCDGRDINITSGLGSNTRVTGIRGWTGRFTSAASSCLALFALLTPLGAVQLLNSRRLDASPRVRAPLEHMLDLGMTRQLESRIVVAGDLPAKLAAFGAWLEERAHQRRVQNRDALRAARAGRGAARARGGVAGRCGGGDGFCRPVAHELRHAPDHRRDTARVRARTNDRRSQRPSTPPPAAAAKSICRSRCANA